MEFNPHPYYLCYQNHCWCFLDDFESSKVPKCFWIKSLKTQGMKYFNITILCFDIIYKLYHIIYMTHF